MNHVVLSTIALTLILGTNGRCAEIKRTQLWRGPSQNEVVQDLRYYKSPILGFQDEGTQVSVGFEDPNTRFFLLKESPNFSEMLKIVEQGEKSHQDVYIEVAMPSRVIRSIGCQPASGKIYKP